MSDANAAWRDDSFNEQMTIEKKERRCKAGQVIADNVVLEHHRWDQCPVSLEETEKHACVAVPQQHKCNCRIDAAPTSICSDN